jgi:hypothetical protein
MERLSEVHQRDPDARPDSEYEAGGSHHLVPGNRGRMLDARRTPIRVDTLCPDIGSWRCEVMAFEDRGAMWTLPVESVTRFQFARGSAYATPEAVADLDAQARRFGTSLIVEPDPECARATLAELERRATEAAEWLARERMLRAPVNADHRSGLAAGTVFAFEAFMGERDLLEMDDALARTYVSNPNSGDRVKGHLIVMAEMGLAPFHGTSVRDPETFVGDWSRDRRADHIMWRTAFVHAMLSTTGLAELELHRGVLGGAGVTLRSGRVLESWSFRRAVAESVAGPPASGGQRAVDTRRVSCRRAFMTYLETRAMSRQFLEEEAVLFADDSVFAEVVTWAP